MTLPVTALFGAPDPGTSPATPPPLGGTGNIGDVLFAHMLQAALGSASAAVVPVIPGVAGMGATPGAPVVPHDRPSNLPSATQPTPTFPGRAPRLIRVIEGEGPGDAVPLPVTVPNAPALALPKRPEAPIDDVHAPGETGGSGAPDGEPAVSVPTTGGAPATDGGAMHALPVPWPVLVPTGAIPAAPGGDDIAFISKAVRSAIERMELSNGRREAGDIVPELRTRLERLVNRMWSDFGYRVEIVETTRTQSRQDTLFAQGRSVPGTVVTWTRASAHTNGRAADVRIDGGWTNTAAFEQLARVAREEGLRTLWPRDPGHIELAPTVASYQLDETPRTPAEAPLSLAPRLANLRVGIGDTGPLPRTPLGDRLPERPPSAALPVHSLPMPWEQRGRPRALPMEPSIGLPVGGNGEERREPPRSGPVALPMPVGRRAELPFPAPPSIQPMPSHSADPHVLAGVAQVATVAPVAQPAIVAAVASVTQLNPDPRVASIPLIAVNTKARTVLPTPDTTGSAQLGAPAADAVASDDVRATPPHVSPSVISALRDRSDALRAVGGERPVREAGREAEGTATPTPRAAAPGEAVAPTLNRDNSMTPASEGREVLHATGTDAAERIARLTDSRDAVRERPLSSVLLKLEAPDGGEDRVRVDLRGTSVGAAFDVRDSGTVDRIGAHVRELARAFERQGLDPESITVRTLRAGDGLAAPLRSAAERELAPGRLETGLGHERGEGGGSGRERDARGGQPRPDDSRDPHGRQRDRRGRQGGHNA